MQVIIKEREYEYKSDYSAGWVFSSGDDFKFPVKVGRYSCFIKRFARNPEKVSGWRLVQSLRATTQPGLPRIHDIVQTEEKGSKVRYLFYECMEGDTLDNVIKDGVVPDIGRLADELFKALGSIHRHEHWMSDFCEKNIFCKKDGGFCLIDLDSTHPAGLRPDNEMYGSKEYWALVFSYLINCVGLKDFKPGDIPGPVLNYLQVVFLILRIRAGLTEGIGNYKSTEFCDKLPELLDLNISAYRELFSDLLNAGVSTPGADDIKRIKALLVENMVDAPALRTEPVPVPNPDPNPGPRPGPDPVKRPPVIGSFSCDKKRLKKGGFFTLSWEVKYEESVSISRNGLPYKIAPKGLGAMTLGERYDGKEKKVVYSMSASNKFGTVNSEPLLFCVGQADPKPLLLAVAGVPVLIVLVLLLVRGIHALWPPQPPPPIVIQKVQPDTAKVGPSMVLGGDAFKRMEDSLTADRKKKMKEAKDARDSAAEEAKRRAAEGKSRSKLLAANAPPVVRDTVRTPVIDEAAIQRERRRERLLLEKRVQDSVSVIDSVFFNKVLGVFRSGVRKLGIRNRSGFFLDTVVVEITPGSGAKPYRKDFFNIKAGAFTVVIDKLSKKESLQATVQSVIF